MSKNDVKALFERMRTWPKERQEDAAEVLALIEEHDRSPYRLTDEQVAEVRRRLVHKNPSALTLDQLDARLRLLGI